MSKEDAYMDGLLYAHLAECEAAQERQEWIERHGHHCIKDFSAGRPLLICHAQ